MKDKKNIKELFQSNYMQPILESWPQFFPIKDLTRTLIEIWIKNVY